MQSKQYFKKLAKKALICYQVTIDTGIVYES